MEWGNFIAENGAAFFWLFVAISAAVVEGMTMGLVSIWFVPGALAAMLLSLFVDSVWLQIAVFLLLSLAVLLLTRKVLKKYPKVNSRNQMNADALIGKRGIVAEEINNLHQTGSVKLNALVWTARSCEESVIIPAGAVVTVCEISGVKLICKPVEEAEEQNSF